MNKAKPIMIQGTMSNAGKSLNSFITDEGLEMGRAQVVQAEAAGVKPSVRMNPILLKPTTDVGSQVIVNGEVRGNMRAADYFKYKTSLIPDIMRAYDSLAAENDILVIEGAGSPAEINLKSADIVNMGMAKMAGAPVLLVGDIDRGGVFAQLYGTVALLEPEERAMVKADIDDEDSLSERLTAGERKEIDIAVVSLPRISNFTDFSPFSRFSGVSLRYVKNLFELGSPDLIVIPGTKSTIADLKWMRQNGLEGGVLKAASRGVPVFGICGGFQMLGTKISDPLGTEGGGEIAGMGLLPLETVFAEQKTRAQTEGVFENLSGIFAPLNGLSYRGYEIHMGQSGNTGAVMQKDNVCGSYIHGLFDGDGIAGAIVRALYEKRGLTFDENAVFDARAYRESQYDKLAEAVRNALDMEMIYRILEEGI